MRNGFEEYGCNSIYLQPQLGRDCDLPDRLATSQKILVKLWPALGNVTGRTRNIEGSKSIGITESNGDHPLVCVQTEAPKV